MDRDDVVRMLLQLELFDRVHEKSVEELVDHGEVIDVADGALLTVENEEGTEVFVLLEGRAVVTSEGRELAVLEAPDLFGEMSAFQGDERTATVRAISAMKLFVVDRRSYAQLLSEEPAFGARVLGAVKTRMDALLSDL